MTWHRIWKFAGITKLAFYYYERNNWILQWFLLLWHMVLTTSNAIDTVIDTANNNAIDNAIDTCFFWRDVVNRHWHYDYDKNWVLDTNEICKVEALLVEDIVHKCSHDSSGIGLFEYCLQCICVWLLIHSLLEMIHIHASNKAITTCNFSWYLNHFSTNCKNCHSLLKYFLFYCVSSTKSITSNKMKTVVIYKVETTTLCYY